jgi:hypothetical protein
MKIDFWNGCYPSKWKGVIVDDAIVHPAKFSSKLIRRIYEHMTEEGWLKAGDVVIDPFGGVALGALDALRLGLRWRGVELERRFVDLGNANIDHWNGRFSQMPQWSGDAVLLQGDSRELVRILSESGQASVSSPPFVVSDGSTTQAFYEYKNSQIKSGKMGGDISRGKPTVQDGYGETDGNLGNMRESNTGFDAAISSPPFLQAEGGTPEPKLGGPIDKAMYERHKASNSAAKGYGSESGQLGNMRGNEEGFAAAISSPPYADGAQHTGGNDLHPEYVQGGKIHLPGINGSVSSPPYADSDQNYKDGWSRFHKTRQPLHKNDIQREAEYGNSDGQLGAMKAGEFSASVSSPPYSEQFTQSGAGLYVDKEFMAKKSMPNFNYGETKGNVGQMQNDDFWLSARAIVEQVFLALAPGAHAVWVVKGFVKNKKYVDFPNQWRQLCEAVGFVTLHEHRAMLVHHKGTQGTLDGGQVELKTESKSFFRRLAEKNGSPRIDYETVWCMEKPA